MAEAVKKKGVGKGKVEKIETPEKEVKPRAPKRLRQLGTEEALSGTYPAVPEQVEVKPKRDRKSTPAVAPEQVEVKPKRDRKSTPAVVPEQVEVRPKKDRKPKKTPEVTHAELDTKDAEEPEEPEKVEPPSEPCQGEVSPEEVPPKKARCLKFICSRTIDYQSIYIYIYT